MESIPASIPVRQARHRQPDAATNKVIDTIKTGKQPTGIDFLPNGRQGYVTDEGSGTVEILNFP